MIYEPQAYAIEDKAMHPFISEREIEEFLAEAQPDRELVREIIAKSLGKKRLSMEETAVLLNAEDPELVEEIHALVEPESQADPKFQTSLAYTRITAKAVHQRLAANTAAGQRHVPAERTVYDILNRLGYRLRRVRKTKPQKKSPRPTPSLTTCDKSIRKPRTTQRRFTSRSTPRPK